MGKWWVIDIIFCTVYLIILAFVVQMLPCLTIYRGFKQPMRGSDVLWFVWGRFDVLMAAQLEIQVFWSVAVRHWVNVDCLLECDVCDVGSVIGLMKLTACSVNTVLLQCII